MRTARLTLVTFFALAASAMLASTASALSCAPIDRPVGPLFDAVALKGPAERPGTLLSPARFRVLRYLDGGGPPTVRVTTGVRRLPGRGRARIGVVVGEFAPHVGEIHRIAGRLPAGAKRIRRGQIVVTSICLGTRPIAEPPLWAMPDLALSPPLGG